VVEVMNQSFLEGGGRIGELESSPALEELLRDWVTGSVELLDFLPEMVIERSVPLPIRL